MAAVARIQATQERAVVLMAAQVAEAAINSLGLARSIRHLAWELMPCLMLRTEHILAAAAAAGIKTMG